MLLIAITGEKGAGKSSLLARLAEWSQAEGRPAEGFVAEAGPRPVAGRGADHYALRWVATGESLPFATRIDTTATTVPYAFHEATLTQTHRWAEALPAGLPMLVLDEFGPMEASGAGHMALWPAIKAARPEVLVLTVRQGLAGDFERLLGRPFDVVVDAAAPEAWERLRAACLAQRDWSRVGLFGAASGGLEMTLGSALHGGMVPLRGLVMSSAQAVVMTRAAAGLGGRGRVVWVPFIAAGLKALSPAGNRLRPMLAITMQGLLYAGTLRLLGWRRIGVAIAAALVGAWAAAQGLVLQYLFVGKELLRAYGLVVDWASRHWGVSPPAIAVAIAGWIALWALTAGTIGALAYGRAQRPDAASPTDMTQLLPDWGRHLAVPSLAAEARPPRWDRALAEGLKDLARPTFWVPLLLVAAIILAAGSPWESAFWVVARAATIGVLLFTAVRLLDFQGAIRALRRRGHWGPAIAFSRALDELARIPGKPRS